MRSLYAGRKFYNVLIEMERIKLGILRICEDRQSGTGICQKEEGTFYCSEYKDHDLYQKPKNGVR